MTLKTQTQIDIILQNMLPQEEYKLEELAKLINKKTTRIRDIVKILIKSEVIEKIGENKNRRYKLK